eukprot:4214626-Amphidinium_carterae.1
MHARPRTSAMLLKLRLKCRWHTRLESQPLGDATALLKAHTHKTRVNKCTSKAQQSNWYESKRLTPVPSVKDSVEPLAASALDARLATCMSCLFRALHATVLICTGNLHDATAHAMEFKMLLQLGRAHVRIVDPSSSVNCLSTCKKGPKA